MDKRIIYFLLVFAYAVCSAGSLGAALYSGGHGVAASVAVLAAMAFPTARKLLKKILE